MLPAPYDAKIRLRNVNQRRLHRLSSKSELWEADSGQNSGDPHGLRAQFSDPVSTDTNSAEPAHRLVDDRPPLQRWPRIFAKPTQIAALSCKLAPPATAHFARPSFTAWLPQSKATTVEEQAVSRVKHGPLREKTWETRPESPEYAYLPGARESAAH